MKKKSSFSYRVTIETLPVYSKLFSNLYLIPKSKDSYSNFVPIPSPSHEILYVQKLWNY